MMLRCVRGQAMLGVEANESELRERLTEIVCATPLMRVLSVARHLCLPDWLVFSGAVYQPVLNHPRLRGHGNSCNAVRRRGQVRRRLAAGGEWIRTISTARRDKGFERESYRR